MRRPPGRVCLSGEGGVLVAVGEGNRGGGRVEKRERLSLAGQREREYGYDMRREEGRKERGRGPVARDELGSAGPQHALVGSTRCRSDDGECSETTQSPYTQLLVHPWPPRPLPPAPAHARSSSGASSLSPSSAVNACSRSQSGLQTRPPRPGHPTTRMPATKPPAATAMISSLSRRSGFAPTLTSSPRAQRKLA